MVSKCFINTGSWLDLRKEIINCLWLLNYYTKNIILLSHWLPACLFMWKKHAKTAHSLTWPLASKTRHRRPSRLMRLIPAAALWKHTSNIYYNAILKIYNFIPCSTYFNWPHNKNIFTNTWHAYSNKLVTKGVSKWELPWGWRSLPSSFSALFLLSIFFLYNFIKKKLCWVMKKTKCRIEGYIED